MTPSSFFPDKAHRFLLPMTFRDTREQITCYDYLGNPKVHDNGQRYVSPSTGVCRRLVVQAVHPQNPDERPITDHASEVSKLALWLRSTDPFRERNFCEWFGTWLLFVLNLLFPFFSIWSYLIRALAEDSEDPALYGMGKYKPYMRPFRRQFWAARSAIERSVRLDGESGPDVPTHSLYPRLLMIREPTLDYWSPCTDPVTITHTKFVAISYCAADINFRGADAAKESFIREVRAAVVSQKFDAYWLDLECLGRNPDEKKLDLYCMADVYRNAEMTLIMLGDASDDAWKRWGARVWTLPEALLSQRLNYKPLGRSEISPISLHQLSNLAYTKYDSEQAIINAYSGKDPLERLERLTLLKSAIWRRGVTSPSPVSIPAIIPSTGPHPADRVYALMGFFEHRIQPDYLEDDLQALARLSMANDNDKIAERMVSLLPSTIRQTACWYADDDVYSANLWDVAPEIQVAGITESGALVLDGCRAASIRWKDFPAVAFRRSLSVRRFFVKLVCYLVWPCILAGAAAWRTTKLGGMALIICGSVLLVAAPWLFIFSEGSRVYKTMPWLIGAKGVLHLDEVAVHLYGGGIRGRHPRLHYTPSGSEFAVPEKGKFRSGARTQYDKAVEAEQGEHAGRMYTLVDTCSSTVYYFSAERPPTVCLFTGREGGLGRFVLCSERCWEDELHKETVLRMPTYVSQRMELCDWVALG